MPNATERIPVPWPQRWETLRERVLPVVCFLATVAACAALWQTQAKIAPYAVGEVHVETVAIKSPISGLLLPVNEDNAANRAWPLYSEVRPGEVIARVKSIAAAGDVVEVAAPFAGRVTVTAAVPGQHVLRGEHLLTIVSPRPDYIVCHLPDREQAPPAAGLEVAIRRQAPGAHWAAAKVEAVGPAVEPVPMFHGSANNVPERGLPVRIALPPDLGLLPGALVEVRFPPTAATR
jgi:multidrug resistance efflux pump